MLGVGAIIKTRLVNLLPNIPTNISVTSNIPSIPTGIGLQNVPDTPTGINLIEIFDTLDIPTGIALIEI